MKMAKVVGRRMILVGTGLLVAALAPSVDAQQLPKRGSFTGIFGWHFPADGMMQVEKDHLMWGGVSYGAFRNDAGSGFLHQTGTRCTAVGEFKDGKVIRNRGECINTDNDGDRTFLTWQCTKCPDGELTFTGGTGKYKGLKGRGTYREIWSGEAGLGWSHWAGDWELPE
jgi:hypothetical protein